MTTLENIKTIANFILEEYGGDTVREYEHAICSYTLTAYEWGAAAKDERLKKIWIKTKKLLDKRGNLNEPKVYVSDVVNMNDIVRGKVNLVYAPCGSGKTTFIENDLMSRYKNPKQNMLYLAPTISLVNAQKHRGKEIEIESPWGDGCVAKAWEYPGVTAMTYAAFGAMMKGKRDSGNYRDSECWNDHSLICADELSQARIQSFYDNNSQNWTRLALEELRMRVKNESNVVVTISATPKQVADEYQSNIHVVAMLLYPDSYKEAVVKEYHDLENLLKDIDADKRGLIYVTQIEEMKKYAKQLKSRGIEADFIFSKRSKDHTMNDRQNAIVDTLVKEERIPDDVQVLLINAAYQTGLNIRPEKSHLDYIIVHSSDQSVQVQARGRYRGDIDVLYRKVKDPVYEISEEKIAPYLSEWMDKKQRDTFLDVVGLKDDHGRPVSWKKFCEIVGARGYGNDQKRTRDKRFWMIKPPGDE